MERDGAEARVGITQYAADALGDVVFAELPEQGRQVVLHVLDDLWPPIPYWLHKHARFEQRGDLLMVWYIYMSIEVAFIPINFQSINI